MSHLNMQYLRTFLVMVEEKSSARTASSRDISQENVRHQIGRLEEAVGKRLLERRFPPRQGEAGRTQLTEDGRAFLPKALEAMRAHDRMFDDKFPDLDPRMLASMLAILALETAEAALKGELSKEEMDRIRNSLPGGPAEAVLQARDRGQDPRPAAEVLARLLQEKALAALNHDLSEQERDLIHGVLSASHGDG